MRRSIVTGFLLSQIFIVFGQNARLETGTLTLEWNEKGALSRLVSKKTGWEMQKRADLALSWKLVVPEGDDKRNCTVLGSKQDAPEIETGENFVRFVWRNVVSERSGRLDINVVQEVRNEGDDAVWHTKIENNSPYVVESVFSPVIGDFYRPEGCEHMQILQPGYCQAGEIDIWPYFTSNRASYGVDVPTQQRWGSAAAEPFIFAHTADMGKRDQGLYMGAKDIRAETVTWQLEAYPGYENEMLSRLPMSDEFSGYAVHTIFSALHQPYIMPGETIDLTPVMLEAYVGGWQAGADVYKRWMRTWSKGSAPAPDWMDEPHSWMQLQVNSPEGELLMPFKELPSFAAELARHGVKAVEYLGWNKGGLDRGYPSHDIDPRLGNYEELKEAIAECEKLGVKIIMFAKFTWADRSEKWYRDELEKYAIKDPYGDAYWYNGYCYFTPAQLLNINTRRFSPMCFGCDSYIEIAKREFAKVYNLGSSGMLYDESSHHMPTLCCFDISHGHRYGWPVYANDMGFIRALKSSIPGWKDGSYLVGGEGCYDVQFEEYNFAHIRSRLVNHIPLQRYIRPEVQIMTSISGFNDRDMVNQCLLHRYIMSYEPFNYHGCLGDFPLTFAYGQRMDALRRELSPWLWRGDYTDKCGASVTRVSDGASHDRYSRFTAADGSSIVVIANIGDEPLKVSVSLDSGDDLDAYRAVDDDSWKPFDGEIEIAPHSAVLARQGGI